MKTEDLKLGQIITSEQQLDAIHVAIAPVVAAGILSPGDHVNLNADGRAVYALVAIGVVDPFLRRDVKEGETFWLFLYPGSITSLRHEWAHPAFVKVEPARSESEMWMRRWAVTHMGQDYYGDGKCLSEEQAYANAIEAGRNISVGPYESARDYIDNEWWNHWEIITGEKGQRGEYFSCGC